ncbi:MAG: type IV pilus biogenesis/stability protein PilW [Gammaproteobacteria bacterium]|jgi:type IV pilus assembly protein PilF
MMVRTLLVVSLVLALISIGGCITEREGGMGDPAAPEARVQAQLDLARGYLEHSNTERARIALNKALDIDSRSVEAHTLLAVLNEAEGENELAERQFKAALGIEPRNSQALNNYGTFLYRQGRYREAVDHLRVLVKDTGYRARAQAYENLGLAELKVGDVDAARESFNRSLQLSFAQPQASLELAQISYDEGNFEAASEYYDGFRSQARQTPRSLCLGMKLAKRSGDTDRMASYALALNNLFPNSKEAHECVVPK